MNEIESIVIYGFAGYIILSDLNLLILGIYQKLQGDRVGFLGENQYVFFVRKILGIAAALVLIAIYRSETLGFLWSFLCFTLITAPEMVWMIWKDMKARRQ